MSDTDSFFVAFGLDDSAEAADSYIVSESLETVQAWVESGGKRTAATSAPVGEGTAIAERPTEGVAEGYPFQRIANDFIRAMHRWDLIIPTTMTLLPRLEKARLNSKLYQPLKRKNTRLHQSVGFEIYQCDLSELNLFKRTGSQLNQLKDGRQALPGVFLMGLVSTYDAFLSDLMRTIFLTKPEMLSASEKNISFKDLIELGSIEAARNQIIEKEVETFLRQSHHAQFENLESRLAVPLRTDLKIWPDFVEVCERRNLFTHTGGVVSRQYLQVCSEHKVNIDDLSNGDQLKITAAYLRNATDVMTELGWKLSQVVWRKLKPAETNEAATALVDASYHMLKAGKSQLVRNMLEFGLSLRRQSDDGCAKTMVVNLAIAIRQQTGLPDAKKVLDKEDWSASSDRFQIRVAAVLGEVDRTVQLIERISEDDIDRDAFRDWPAFQWVIADQKFVQAFEERFSEPFLRDRGTEVSNAAVGDSPLGAITEEGEDGEGPLP